MCFCNETSFEVTYFLVFLYVLNFSLMISLRGLHTITPLHAVALHTVAWEDFRFITGACNQTLISKQPKLMR